MEPQYALSSVSDVLDKVWGASQEPGTVRGCAKNKQLCHCRCSLVRKTFCPSQRWRPFRLGGRRWLQLLSI